MGQVHYELFVRRKVGAQWTLEIATENRTHALQVAEDVLVQSRAVAVRVSKETLDPSTGEYKSTAIFTKGMVDGGKPKKEVEDKTADADLSDDDLDIDEDAEQNPDDDVDLGGDDDIGLNTSDDDDES